MTPEDGSRGPDSERRRFRTTFVQANMNLVIKAARLLRGRGVPFSDLVQEGSVALVAALENLEPTSELDLRKHAELAIQQRLRELVEAGDGSETKSSGLLQNAEGPDAWLEGLETEKIEKAQALLSLLTKDEEQVLKLRFGIDSSHPLTLEAVAQNLGVNRWRVSGLESRALSALRRAVHRLRWTFPK